jgi:hypothetical protein
MIPLKGDRRIAHRTTQAYNVCNIHAPSEIQTQDPSDRVTEGRAVAQRLDAGFPTRRPGFASGQHVGFVVDKAALGQVFSEYFGFPCRSFHRFLHYHNHPGLTQ